MHDIAYVGGTRMAVTVQTAKGGGNAIGILLLNADSTITGTYSAGISDHYATLIQFTGPGKTKVIFRHAAY